MSHYALCKSAGTSGFGHGSTAEQVTDGLDLSGKRVLVTGAAHAAHPGVIPQGSPDT